MPGRSLFGRHGNRSQHNLVDQQAQQQIQQQQQAQQHLQHQQQLQAQQQQQQKQQQVGGPDHPLPPPPHPHQQLQQPPPLASQPGSTVGTGGSPAVSDIGPPPGPPPSAISNSSNPPSASSAPDPSPSDLYSQQLQLQHQLQQQPHPQQQQQQQQGDATFPPQPLSQQSTGKLQKRQPQQQVPPHLLQQQSDGGYQGRPGSLVFASSNPNLPQNPPPVPLNQATASTSFGAQPYGSQPPLSPPSQLQQQQQQQQQVRGGVQLDTQGNSDFVSRSQSARYPQQHIPPLQTQPPFNTNSAEDLSQPHTISSPIVTQRQPSGPIQAAPPPETQKRSARGLIRSFIKGSSSKDSHNLQASEESSGISRKHSKRSSVGIPLSLRNNNPSQVSLDQQQAQQQQQHYQSQPPQPPSGWQSHGQPSPLHGVGEVDETYSESRPSQDPNSQSYPHTPQLNAVRHIQPDSESSPYSGQDSLTPQQKQQLFTQQQSQTEQDQPPYNQGANEPGNPSHQYQLVPPPAPYSTPNRGNLYAGHLSTASSHTINNADTISQLSHDSPTPDSEYPATQQSIQIPSALKTSQSEYQTVNSEQTSPSSQQIQNMPPPPPAGGTGPARRSGEADAQMRGGADGPGGPPPGYRHNQAPSMNNMNPLPPTPGPANPATPAFRAATVAERQFDGAGQEGGRNSPQPPATEREAEVEKNYKDLLTKYKNVKRLYFDGKAQIEQMTAQIELLQNAVANQRMSQSRTALDDNEYSTRFNRLNGAINNLSFNIRKDWRSLPPWIESFVTPDGLKTGKQEMTAVGRAVIAKWLVDEVFNKCFHPALDPQLSHHLKSIERNIRQFSYTMNSQEEFDALTSKVVNWRMATLEGLQHMLNSSESQEARAEFTRMVTTNLTASLLQYLVEPAPAGVDGSASMIVELAIGLAANLPLESRDIAIIYPLPGDPIRPEIMEPEKGALPPLTDITDEDDESEDEKATKAGKPKTGAAPTTEKVGKIRFAGSVAVEVRGRQVLVKAPVWAL